MQGNKLRAYFSFLFKQNNLTLLNNRCILSFQGQDAQNVLQGITTNDMKIFHKNQKLQSIYTNFLNIQGRILFDAIVVRPHVQQIYHYINMKDFKMDHGNSQRMNFGLISIKLKNNWLQNILKNISFGKKPKFMILILNQVCIHYMQQNQYFHQKNQFMVQENNLGEFIDQKNDNTGLDDGDYRNMVFVDPRLKELGTRIITNDPNQIEVNKEAIKFKTLEMHDAFRYYTGVLEGIEIEDVIPYHVNMDFLNAISLTKGCFVGQEVLQRTYHTGIIRRRAIPFIFGEEKQKWFREIDQDLTEDYRGKPIITQSGKTVGKVILNKWNIGMAQLRYFEIQNEDCILKVADKQISLLLNQTLQPKLVEYMKTVIEKEKNALEDQQQ